MFRALFRRSRFESDMADELGFHVQARAEDLVRTGVPREEANRRARMEFGAVESYKEECRRARGLRVFDELRGDLLYAFRMLRKNPGFALVAVLSLALGIGANTLIFSVLNGLFLRPLPIEEPDRVYFLQRDGRFANQSFPDFRDLRDRNRSFTGIMAYRIAPVSIEKGGAPVRAWGYLATGNYFDVLGVRPALGRFFHAVDDVKPGANPLVVLGYDYWQTRFSGDARALGSTIRINRLPYTIIGVAPPGFRGTELFYMPDLWVPMMMQAQIEPGNPWLENRDTYDAWVCGRLRPGITTQEAQADLDLVAAQIAREFPRSHERYRLKLTRPGLLGDVLRGPVQAFTAGLLGLAALVLMAACANLASTLTARAADRRREVAVRASIGAGTGRLVRQFLTETLALAMAGGAAGCALAVILAKLLSGRHGLIDFPSGVDVTADWRVFAFALTLSAAAGMLFGLAPARYAMRVDLNSALKGTDSGRRLSRQVAFRDLIVGVQIALCVVLVAGCFLSVRGLQHALRMPLGFEPRGVSVISFELGLAGYDRNAGNNFQRRALMAVQALPGVDSAAYSNSLPLTLDQSHTRLYPEDKPNPRLSDGVGAAYYQVSPGFFRTLGIRLIAGRDFDWHDDAKSPRVAILNRTLATRLLGGVNVVGRRFRYGELIQVAGVVEDAKTETLTEDPEPCVYWPMLQSYNATTTLVARSHAPETEMVAAMRRAVQRLDEGLPLYQTGSLEQLIGFAYFPMQAAVSALSAFGLLALVLAATGIHGVVAYAVARRTREIGIRVAAGARPVDVLRLVVSRMAILIAAGGALGVVLTIAAGRVLSNIVYLISPRDPVTLASVCITMVAVAAASCWMPARRAVRIDPMAALRYE
jgi:predicted permease